MSIEYFSIYWCLQFLMSISYSLQCTALSAPWLNLFLVTLFDAIINGIIVLISLIVCLVYINVTDSCILILYLTT